VVENIIETTSMYYSAVEK